MSGGQMQRVAIARALVNDPEILLADEPTGALDTTTSVQIMEILKEISRERLIIMVTHNPELAETYSTRIIKVLDGEVISDSDPYTAPPAEQKAAAPLDRKAKKAARKEKKKQKTSMSFWTALSLSLNNLATKKGRTIMTSFAGSIGIIGIALILALSTGINAFIAQVQEDTLSTYPLTINKHTQDMSAMLEAMTSTSNGKDYSDSNEIHVDDSLGTMMGAMSSTVENNLEKFKLHLEANKDTLKDHVSDIQYTYDYNLQVYTADGKVKVGMETLFQYMGDAFSGMTDLMEMSGGMGMDVFSEMINNQGILDQQYEVIAGSWPTEGAHDEVVLVVNSNNQISKMTLYMLGILNPEDIEEEMKDLMNGEYKPTDMDPFSYDYFLNLKFKLLTTADFFEKTSKTYETADGTYNVWTDLRETPGFDQEAYVTENGVDVKIVGIVRPKEGAAATSISGAIGYTKALTEYVLGKNADSEVINQQKKTPNVNVLTGLAFERTKYTPETIQELVDKIDAATMDMFYAYMTEQILNNPEFSDRIQVTDKQSFLGMYMLLPTDKQAEIFDEVLTAAKEGDVTKRGVSTICTIVSGTTGGIDVTADNFTKLLPVLDVTSVLLAYNGISGLAEIPTQEAMQPIYNKVNDYIAIEAETTADNFLTHLMMCNPMQQAEILGEVIDAAVAADKDQVNAICGIVSATAGVELNADNLKASMPSLMTNPMSIYTLLGGIDGLCDLAGEEAMSEIYTKLTESIKTMQVNEEIFVTLLGTLEADDEAFIQLEETLYGMAPQIDATYESVLKTLDDAELASPDAISFFAKDFESKDFIEQFIADYNDSQEDKKDKLQYSDFVGALMSSVTIIVNAISYVLIAFVAISLVVSSIMIGIITNISVLERTKEIGILRAIGASKKDVSRVFNAETLIIGLAAGAIGIISTLILCVPITAIVQYFTGLDNIRAILPWEGAVILVIISMILTLVAGIIPSRSAAKKDPVIALRTE
ncbi:MAG: FtsX-like permease family protein [Clostridia bacterium]|nr:FtsX-like permease family protein [Clostridia bacterium]